jgi:hypothetical protein
VRKLTTSLLLVTVVVLIDAYEFRAVITPAIKADPAVASAAIPVSAALLALVYRAVKLAVLPLSFAMFELGSLAMLGVLLAAFSTEQPVQYAAAFGGFWLLWYWIRDYLPEDADTSAKLDRLRPWQAVPVAAVAGLTPFLLAFHAVTGSWLPAIGIIGAPIGAVLLLLAVAWLVAVVRARRLPKPNS